MKYALLLLVAIFFQCCTGRYEPPVYTESFSVSPAAPDYSKESSWAALPGKKDNADRFPSHPGFCDLQETASADVFFIHPTSYTRHTSLSTGWNADPLDAIINEKTDDGSILYQASVFNGCGKIYAPRYRQAFIYAYYTADKKTAKQAFDTAYADVKTAFEYYLSHYNNGRPFIIASHSQGTTHAIRLVHELFDKDSTLTEKLIAAYLVGMPVYDTAFTVIQPCREPNATGCYTTWRTYAADYFPPGYQKPLHEIVCTNPVTWVTDSVYVSREKNNGGILRNFDKVVPNLCDAQVLDGVVRIHKPYFSGRAFVNFKNYHVVDYNLFYLSIRQNAMDRVNSFLLKKNLKSGK